MNERAIQFFSAVLCRFFCGVQFFRELDRQTQALLLVFVFLVAVGNSKIVKGGDDIYFGGIDSFLFTYLKERYLTWSSRVVVEMVMLPVVSLPTIFFKWVNTLIILTLPFVLARLVVPRAKMGKLLFPAMCFVIMYPFSNMNTAGWIATCTNYLWPLAAALLAVLPLRKRYDMLPVRSGEYLFAFLCMIFACSNELLCAVFLLLIPLYVCFLDRKCPRAIWIYAAIVVASLLVIVLCPGNVRRLFIEIVTWMPQFEILSLVQKLYYGYMSMVVPLFFHTNFVLLGLSAALCFGVFQKYTALPLRLSALLPFFAHLLSAPTEINESALYVTVWTQYGFFFLSFFVIFSLALSIYLLSDTVHEFCFVVGFLGTTFCSRGALSFSPTMFGSGLRTMLYVYVALAIAALWAYARIYNTLSSDMRMCFQLTLAVFALLSFA